MAKPQKTRRARSTSARAPSKRRASTVAEPAPTPRLLSGGNPQIAKADGDAPVRAYIQAMPGWKRQVGERLDDLAQKAVPGVRRAVRWNSPFYGAPGDENRHSAGAPGHRGWFMAFHCITKYVKVSFFQGDRLRPVPPEPSKLPHVRYVHIHEHDLQNLDERQLLEWMRQAAELPGERMF